MHRCDDLCVRGVELQQIYGLCDWTWFILCANFFHLALAKSLLEQATCV